MDNVISAVEAFGMETINKLEDFLVDKMNSEYDGDVVSDIQKFIKEFKSGMKVSEPVKKKQTKKTKAKGGEDGEPKKEKAKRAPSAYNLFVKSKMSELKAANPSLKGAELMSLASKMWKDAKAGGDCDAEKIHIEVETEDEEE